MLDKGKILKRLEVADMVNCGWFIRQINSGQFDVDPGNNQLDKDRLCRIIFDLVNNPRPIYRTVGKLGELLAQINSGDFDVSEDTSIYSEPDCTSCEYNRDCYQSHASYMDCSNSGDCFTSDKVSPKNLWLTHLESRVSAIEDIIVYEFGDTISNPDALAIVKRLINIVSGRGPYQLNKIKSSVDLKKTHGGG